MDSVLSVVFWVAVTVACAYGAGRLHQHVLAGADRVRAHRDGHAAATQALFPVAARAGAALAPAQPRMSHAVISQGRHSAENRGATTRRLASMVDASR